MGMFFPHIPEIASRSGSFFYASVGIARILPMVEGVTTDVAQIWLPWHRMVVAVGLMLAMGIRVAHGAWSKTF